MDPAIIAAIFNRQLELILPLTTAQQEAIAAEGNVLVEAGAGAGKTSTLVARCLHRVLAERDPVSLDEILMVTFTEAAAAEMRKRIREELNRKAMAQPADGWLSEQLALLDTANICTLHSFCLRLVREHFYELALDPQLTVLEETQSGLLAAETLDVILQRHYAGESPNAAAVQELILQQARGWDASIRELVLRLHHYTQTRPDPAEWFQRQQRSFSQAEPVDWERWLMNELTEWRRAWLETLAARPPDNPNAQQCLAALRDWPEQFTRTQAAAGLARILAADDNWPPRKKGAFRSPLKELFADADFLQSLVQTGGGPDPLVEDWNWVRPAMTTLLELAQEFSRSFASAKRELGALDFHDLEQFALRLLWDGATRQPTAIAQHWRAKLKCVFVDEYQDINAAQDKIIQCLGRDDTAANRFLVGDVKQSIYRFRLADPHIFQTYKESWGAPNAAGRVLPLTDNFRSHEAILNFVNAVFSALMRPEIGGVDYDERARLRFGAPQERAALALASDPAPRVELLLRLSGGETANEDAEPGEQPDGVHDLANLTAAEMEARLIALRLRELKEQGFQIHDREQKSPRPVEWSDMVVLLRSPRNKAESFAKVFAQLGVPLEAARGGFFETTEVSDLLSLLWLLDNPLQDVPALAVLRSPLVGMTLDELAAIRQTQPREMFWLALEAFHRQGAQSGSHSANTVLESAAASAWPKVDALLKSYAGWRRLVRQGSLSHCLEMVLDETHYEDWLRAQPRGEQKRANAQRFLAMTRQFDQFQRQGLFRFVKFVESLQQTEEDREPAGVGAGDAVRLMSIHKSKGLEFPIVVVAGLGTRFNFRETHGDILLDEEFGLCPHVHPPESDQRYQSLPYWLAVKRQKREMLGEELRLLYVALTRACDQLILVGSSSRERAEAGWSGAATARLANPQILSAKQPLDWIGPLLPHLAANPEWLSDATGQNDLLNWRLVDSEDPAKPTQELQATKESGEVIDASSLEALRRRLAWEYPHRAAANQAAKTSVSAIRRRLAEAADEEAQPWFKVPRRREVVAAAGELSAAEVGTAHHLFLQFASLEKLDGVNALTQEADRLAAAGALSREQRGALDLESLAAFWSSEIGQKIRAQSGLVRRELPFTARFGLEEIAAEGFAPAESKGDGEFVVVQGVADLVVLRAKEIWLLDFKTDQLSESELAAKVKMYEPQMKLYAAALERIYRRPVAQRWLHFLPLRKTVGSPAVEPLGA